MRRALVLVSLLASGPAFAHAELDRAEPRVGATVAVAPAAVVLNFSEDLLAEGSSGSVHDSAGARVDVGGLKLIGPASRASLRLRKLGAGEYVVRWRARTDDGVTTQGLFVFTVAPGL